MIPINPMNALPEPAVPPRELNLSKLDVRIERSHKRSAAPWKRFIPVLVGRNIDGASNPIAVRESRVLPEAMKHCGRAETRKQPPRVVPGCRVGRAGERMPS